MYAGLQMPILEQVTVAGELQGSDSVSQDPLPTLKARQGPPKHSVELRAGTFRMLLQKKKYRAGT